MQEMFDLVRNHLLAQGERAQTEMGVARLRIERDGRKLSCAVGCLLPPGKYDASMEGLPLERLLSLYPHLLPTGIMATTSATRGNRGTTDTLLHDRRGRHAFRAQRQFSRHCAVPSRTAAASLWPNTSAVFRHAGLVSNFRSRLRIPIGKRNGRIRRSRISCSASG